MFIIVNKKSGHYICIDYIDGIPTWYGYSQPLTFLHYPTHEDAVRHLESWIYSVKTRVACGDIDARRYEREFTIEEVKR